MKMLVFHQILVDLTSFPFCRSPTLQATQCKKVVGFTSGVFRWLCKEVGSMWTLNIDDFLDLVRTNAKPDVVRMEPTQKIVLPVDNHRAQIQRRKFVVEGSKRPTCDHNTIKQSTHATHAVSVYNQVEVFSSGSAFITQERWPRLLGAWID